MNTNLPYTYTVLRYVHDVMTGEFVNVGLVMRVPDGRVVARTRSTYGRVKSAFPDLNREAFISTMRAVRRVFAKLNASEATSGLLPSEGDARDVAIRAIPVDESSLQWSPRGSGITNDLQATFDRLYDRLVARYDTRGSQRRTDDEVWRPVRQKLEEKKLAQHLHETTIAGSVDKIVFKHAWKNGQWHVYEPVSFDLAEPESIRSKARAWLGHLSAVVAEGDVEPFKPHFIVGAPSDPSLQSAYEAAVAILRRAPNSPEIFRESELDKLVAQIEDEVRAHETADTQF